MVFLARSVRLTACTGRVELGFKGYTHIYCHSPNGRMPKATIGAEKYAARQWHDKLCLFAGCGAAVSTSNLKHFMAQDWQPRPALSLRHARYAPPCLAWQRQSIHKANVNELNRMDINE